jgi:hypothetical protein
MAESFEQTLRDLFGESVDKIKGFQSEQVGKLTAKIQEVAREAVKPELARMQSEISDLRTRIAGLEAEKARAAEEGLEPPPI